MSNIMRINLTSKISFQFKSKFILTPWFKKTSIIKYSTNNNHSRTDPVKNIPNKSTFSNDLKTSLPTTYSNTIHSIGKKSQEYIELEEEFCENETSRSEQDAENFAIGALATRALTAVELQKKLRAKKFAPSVIDKVMKGLQDKGLVNDGLYAEIYSQSRWSSSTWGPKRIKQALYRKGVSEVDANKATKYVFEDSGGGDNGEQNVLGMSKVSMDHLFSQTSKQWLRSQNVEYEKRKSRIIRWLQYRGFSWGVVNFILKKLESQYPP